MDSTTPHLHIQNLIAYGTNNGRGNLLGILICADSWYPEPYRVLRSGNVDMVAVPSFLAHDNVWDRPWNGYDPARTPPDVEPGDVGRLSEGKAWLKYALASKLAGAGIEHGISVFLRGHMWDIGADGHTVVVHQGTVLEAEHVDGAALVNSWL